MSQAENPVLKKLREKHANEIVETDDFRGDLVIVVKGGKILDILQTLKDDPEPRFEMLLDICGADYPGRKERFDVVYHLVSLSTRHRLRLKVRISESDPVVDSATSVFKSANWFEREAYDMFGIRFRNHPRLERLLCHNDFEGHALRKDYPSGARHKCTGVIPLEPE